MWFERAYVWLCAIERNILYPLTFINCITRYARDISFKFGPTYVLSSYCFAIFTLCLNFLLYFGYFLIVDEITRPKEIFIVVMILIIFDICHRLSCLFLFRSQETVLCLLISDKFYFNIFFSFGPLIITVSAMKLLRSSFTAAARQHIVLIWTVLFFEFDYRHSSETFPIDYFVMSIFVDKVNFIIISSPYSRPTLRS